MAEFIPLWLWGNGVLRPLRKKSKKKKKRRGRGVKEQVTAVGTGDSVLWEWPERLCRTHLRVAPARKLKQLSDNFNPSVIVGSSWELIPWQIPAFPTFGQAFLSSQRTLLGRKTQETFSMDGECLQVTFEAGWGHKGMTLMVTAIKHQLSFLNHILIVYRLCSKHWGSREKQYLVPLSTDYII